APRGTRTRHPSCRACRCRRRSRSETLRKRIDDEEETPPELERALAHHERSGYPGNSSISGDVERVVVHRARRDELEPYLGLQNPNRRGHASRQAWGEFLPSRFLALPRSAGSLESGHCRQRARSPMARRGSTARVRTGPFRSSNPLRTRSANVGGRLRRRSFPRSPYVLSWRRRRVSSAATRYLDESRSRWSTGHGSLSTGSTRPPVNRGPGRVASDPVSENCPGPATKRIDRGTTKVGSCSHQQRRRASCPPPHLASGQSSGTGCVRRKARISGCSAPW